MNEIIKEIATKAKLEHCVSHVRLQEFAKFIIQETIAKMSQQLDFYGDCQANNPAYYKAVLDTEKYFGVEE